MSTPTLALPISATATILSRPCKEGIGNITNQYTALRPPFSNMARAHVYCSQSLFQNTLNAPDARGDSFFFFYFEYSKLFRICNMRPTAKFKRKRALDGPYRIHRYSLGVFHAEFLFGSKTLGILTSHLGAHDWYFFFNFFIHNALHFPYLFCGHFHSMGKINAQSLLGNVAPALFYVTSKHNLECPQQQMMCGMEACCFF